MPAITRRRTRIHYCPIALLGIRRGGFTNQARPARKPEASRCHPGVKAIHRSRTRYHSQPWRIDETWSGRIKTFGERYPKTWTRQIEMTHLAAAGCTSESLAGEMPENRA